MERIMSTKNEYVKELRSLRLAKYRREYGKFLAERAQVRPEEALRYAPVEALLFLEGQEDATLLASAAEQGARQIAVSPAVMEAVSEAESPQGMAAVVRRGGEKPFLPAGVLVALEDVADPTNVGAIVRTADAIGAAGVLLSAGCADATSPRACARFDGQLVSCAGAGGGGFPGGVFPRSRGRAGAWWAATCVGTDPACARRKRAACSSATRRAASRRRPPPYATTL